MKEELAKLYNQYLKELDEYENNPYRNRHNFWDRTEHEGFEGFMNWITKDFIN